MESNIIAIENSIREKKHKIKTSFETERRQLIKEIQTMYPDLQNKELEQIRSNSLSTYHLKYIRYGIEHRYDRQQITELCNPEYDIWQIKLICVGFDNGVPIGEIQPYIDTGTLMSFEERENGLICAINKHRSTIKTKITSSSHTVMTPKYKRERGN